MEKTTHQTSKQKRFMDQKETDENTEFIKEEHDPKRNYIFQKSAITKTGFWIIIAFLLLIGIGLLVSGLFFSTPSVNS